MSSLPRRARGPILGGPIVRYPVAELRPESCDDCADTPRGTQRAPWTLLEVIGAVALIGAWCALLWEGLAQLVGPK